MPSSRLSKERFGIESTVGYSKGADENKLLDALESLRNNHGLKLGLGGYGENAYTTLTIQGKTHNVDYTDSYPKMTLDYALGQIYNDLKLPMPDFTSSASSRRKPF